MVSETNTNNNLVKALMANYYDESDWNASDLMVQSAEKIIRHSEG